LFAFLCSSFAKAWSYAAMGGGSGRKRSDGDIPSRIHSQIIRAWSYCLLVEKISEKNISQQQPGYHLSSPL
jgi:hypothetical protein